MSARGRIVAALAVGVMVLAVPSSASAHAYLIRTVPAASGVLNGPPPNVQLTYDEAVEPKFAIISVTNPAGQQQTTGPVRRSAADPDTLIVPLRPHLPEGWYLIYWRAISVDGHRCRARSPMPSDRTRPGAEVRGAEHRLVGDLTEPAGGAVGDVPVGDDRDRTVRVPVRDRPIAPRRVPGRGCARSRSRS